MADVSSLSGISPSTLVLILAAFVLSAIALLWPYRIFKKMGVPGPTPLPLFGTFFHYLQGFKEFDQRSFKKYGRVWGTYDGRLPLLVVADTSILKTVLVKDSLEFFTNRRNIGLNGPFKEAMSLANDEKWKRIRNILSPTFSGGKIKQMCPLIVRCADALVKNLHEKCQSGKLVDLKETFGAYSMDVIASSAFSTDVDSQNNPNDPFVIHGKSIFKINLLNPLVALIGRVDFLQLMVDVQLSESMQKGDYPHSDKYLTDSELEAQAILFLLAGYDTTSTAITFVAYSLACNPDVQTKVQQEIDTFLPDDTLPSYEILKQMEYLDMVVSETLRMYPPTSRTDRVCKKTTVVNDLVIPKGVVVTVPLWVLHYDPQYWDEPHEFRPERFSKEAKEARDPYCYLPFGHGPRNCIGMRFALMSMKIAVCRILQRYSFQTCSETMIPPLFAKSLLLQLAKNACGASFGKKERGLIYDQIKIAAPEQKKA
ncbi:cytochrome P450 3A8-like [Petromyzon marinus]|uniref:cytochrome P450 3A8-like n=1 Tax=Petromyzon marinus TaxID=7757 RepID=UPI003F7031B9